MPGNAPGGNNGGARKNKNGFPSYLPTSRLKAILEEELATMEPLTNISCEYGAGRLAAMTGLGERRIRAILLEEGATVKFETAEKILIGLGKEEYWHLKPEDGGLADWYEADELPELPLPTLRQRLILYKHTKQRRKCRERHKAEAVTA